MFSKEISQLWFDKGKVAKDPFIFHIAQHHHHTLFQQNKPLWNTMVQISVRFKQLPHPCSWVVVMRKQHGASRMILHG